jgi:hypothetical protein
VTIEELDRLKAVADQRWAAYRARLENSEDAPSLRRFAELERQARRAFNEALAQWDSQQTQQD